MKYLILFICFLSSTFIHAQCDGVHVLLTQSDVDSFRIKNGQCDSVYIISVSDAFGIDNVDSLTGIKHITNLGITISDSSEFSFDGLGSLQNVNKLNLFTHFDVKRTLHNLRSVDTVYLNYRQKILKFELLDSLVDAKFISFTGEGPLNSMDRLRVHPQIEIQISNRTGGALSEIIPDTMTSIYRLNLGGLDNFDISTGIALDTIEGLGIGRTSNMDWERFTNAKILSELGIRRLDQSNQLHDGFIHATDLDELTLDRVSSIEHLSDIVPNIKAVKKNLILRRNPILNNIEPLAYLDIPEEFDLSTSIYNHYVVIAENPNLHVCDVSYVCEALKTYPDEVLIYGNGPRCHRDTLLQQGCRTTSLDGIDLDNIQLFPNPTSETFTVQGFSGQYQILSTSGQIHLSGTIDDQKEINITRLTLSGPYFLRLIKEESVHIIPFIKNP